MNTILNVTIPFFAVIGCGYLAAVLGILGHAARAGLNGFIFYFALPVLLFSVISGSDFDQGFPWRFVTAWCLVSVVLFVLLFAAARGVFKLGSAEGALHALGGVYGNVGYVGIPLVVVAFGPDASVPVIMSLTVDLVLIVPLAMIFIEATAGSEEGRPILRTLGQSIRTVAANPLIIAIAAGTMVSISGLEPPQVIARFTQLLGTAAAPCALFALGSSLYGQPVRGALAEVGIVTLAKLVVHPLLIWYVMFQLFGVDELWGFAAVTAASMPVAATVYVLAQRYETYVVRTSTAIALSTAVSILTISAILAYLSASGLAITPQE